MTEQTITEQLKKLLNNLSTCIESIRGIVISTSDGLEIASKINDDRIDVPLMHAITASLMGLSNRAVYSLGLPALDKTVIFTREGIVVVFNLHNKIAFSAVLEQDANVGLAVIEMQNRLKEIEDILGYNR